MSEENMIRLIAWLLSDETGISSKNIVRRFMGLPIEFFGWPHDAGDFGRCYRLLMACPFIDIDVMKDTDKVWARLVDKWQEITRLYETKHYLQLYFLIDKVEGRYRKNSTLHYDDVRLSYRGQMEQEYPK